MMGVSLPSGKIKSGKNVSELSSLSFQIGYFAYNLFTLFLIKLFEILA